MGGCNCHRNRVKKNNSESKRQRRMDRAVVNSRESRENDKWKKIEMVRRIWEESKNETDNEENTNI